MRIRTVLDVFGGIFLVAILATLARNPQVVKDFLGGFQGILRTAISGQ